jgi:hypothetical protein
MAERARLLVAAVVMAVGVSVVVPALALAVELPGESCPTVLPGTSSTAVCGEGTHQSGGSGGGGGGLNFGGLLPILGAALGGATIALIAAYVVLRRRTAMPVAPLDPSEWWTCAKCGKNNVIDSPRCYACGSWRT